MAEESAVAGVGALVTPQDLGISVARDPRAVIAEAHNAAKALKDIIEAKPDDKKVMMGGEQYIEFDDWQMVAKFYGLTAKVVSTEYIEIGGARGFNAKAVAFHGLTGQDVSAAESMCLNDEDKWSTRPKYEYKDGKRVRVGEVPVPLFQLKSMAQTRACAKALRNVLSGVVVLAGYRPAVFEEMTGDEEVAQAKPQVQAPTKETEPQKYETTVILVADVKKRDVKTKSGPSEVFAVYAVGETVKYETWSKEIAEKAKAAIGLDVQFRVSFVADSYGRQIKSFEAVEAQVGE